MLLQDQRSNVVASTRPAKQRPAKQCCNASIYCNAGDKSRDVVMRLSVVMLLSVVMRL